MMGASDHLRANQSVHQSRPAPLFPLNRSMVSLSKCVDTAGAFEGDNYVNLFYNFNAAA